MKTKLSLILVALLTACGGGGDSSTLSATLAPAPQSTQSIITFDGPRSDYAILKKSDSFVVTDKNGVSQIFTSADVFRFVDLNVNLKMGEAYRKIPVTDMNAIIELYIAYFSRIPDADGLEYWIGRKVAGMTFDQIGESFYRAGLNFSEVTGYTDSMTNADFIKVIYRNVLGRESVDQEGLNYWNFQLSNGTATRGTLVRTILNSAHTFKGDKNYGFVADHLDNKLLVANLISIQQGITYQAPEESIRKTVAIVSAVTPIDTSRAIEAFGKIDWFFRQIEDLRTAPVPVQRTSYLNAKNINIAPQIMPISNEYVKDEAITAGHAYGDFFQDGTISMVAATNVFAGRNGFGSTVAGRIYFFHSDGKGGWIDQTEKLIGDDARTGCISPRKIIVADFNSDKKPDVFVACHGIDGEIPQGFPQGEKPRYLLSQADGKYKNFQLELNCYCHGAAAADFNNDGYADIVLASPPVLGRLAYLKNNHDGSFSDVQDKLPPSTNRKSIWSLDFIDANKDGLFDLAVYGSENNLGWNVDPSKISQSTPGTSPWDIPFTIFLNSHNSFSDDARITLPCSAQGDILDIIFVENKIAFLRASNNPSGTMQVQTLSYPSMQQLNLVKIKNEDTVWFTLYNNSIVGAFAWNTYVIRF
ncbi:FG-GAP-like repeat-containing protein [Undibacterium fentianense]|uniref:VCBS repeat-containing protein n=1 Tax=Undibacterium fentianense TaxID=2828728 RepID=A0A941E154_9BURK|nr:FG-GAP-like repeat-containing protein [Undibacterium fentianense]MBR7800500.1 VCBS repeat-containing protein [Undibacterium fentianense]